MNTTPVRTGGLSWIYVTKLEALPMGKLGLSIPWNSGLVWRRKCHREHISKCSTSQIHGVGFEILGKKCSNRIWSRAICTCWVHSSFFLEFCTADPSYSYLMIWHKFGEVTVPVGESEIISVQKNTWQGPGAPYDVCLCLVVGKNGREKGKNGDQSTNPWESV